MQNQIRETLRTVVAYQIRETLRTVVAYLRSMSAAFRMYLLHLDNDLSCIGSARARSVAPFRMHLLYLNSVPDEPAHRSPREGRGLLDAGCDRLCCSTAQVTVVMSHAQSCTDSSAAVALVASKSVIFVSLPM